MPKAKKPEKLKRATTGTKKKSAMKSLKKVAKKVASKVAKKVTRKVKETLSSVADNNYKIAIGDNLKAVSVQATSGKTIDLFSRTKAKFNVFYFYPRDSTPGCTLEGQDFKRLYTQFQKLGCEIYGVSMDSLTSHEKFKSNCGFPFELISDQDGSLCRAFDVIQMKSMYGRSYEGIERSTFVVAGSGQLLAAWRKVKVPGHAESVLDWVVNNGASS